MEKDEFEEFDWYYDLDSIEQEGDYPDINDPEVMYARLAVKIAARMYNQLYEAMYAFARETESPFYGDYPTIWEQMQRDTEHGEFMNEEQLEVKCHSCLDSYKELEIYLLWVYASKQSGLLFVYDNEPDIATCRWDICKAILGALYRAAEQEASSFH